MSNERKVKYDYCIPCILNTVIIIIIRIDKQTKNNNN